jgi:glycerophosphoryl diester phosphodiesterase
MSNLSPMPNFKLIGHRGAAGLAAENTLESFITAAAQGLNWIEFDIRLTKDQAWAVIHDATVDRTTTASGAINMLSLAEIKQLDSGKIPSLQEALAVSKQYSLCTNIEVKGSELNSAKHADLLLEFIHANLAINSPSFIISSFDLTFLKILRVKNSRIAISYLIKKISNQSIQIAYENNFTTVNCYFNNLKIADLDMAKKYSIPVLVYTINDPKIAKFWLSHGVAAVFTDRPDLLKTCSATNIN